MNYDMKLNPEPFSAIESGEKKIEIRLFDEKRSKIAINDTIQFTNLREPNKQLSVRVTGLVRCKTFQQLLDTIKQSMLGGEKSIEQRMKGIRQIYSEEKEQQYGVLGIIIELM